MFSWTKPKPPTPETFLPWTSSLRIGITRFDLEHRHMVDLLNQLHTLMVVKRDRVAADQLTDLLLQATRAHFASEEALLGDLGYPALETHTHEHSNLIDELRDLQRQFKAGTISALAMPTFLRKWLLGHIESHDRRYVEFLRSKGER